MKKKEYAVYKCEKCKDAGWIDVDGSVTGYTWMEKCSCQLDDEVNRLAELMPAEQTKKAFRFFKEIKSGKMSQDCRRSKEIIDMMVDSKSKIKLVYGSVGHGKTTISILYAMLKTNLGGANYRRVKYFPYELMAREMSCYNPKIIYTSISQDMISKYKNLRGNMLIIDDMFLHREIMEPFLQAPIRDIIDNFKEIVVTTNLVPGDRARAKKPEMSFDHYVNWSSVLDHFKDACTIKMIGNSHRS